MGMAWGSRCFPNGMVCRGLSVCISVACGVLHCVHRMGTVVLWYVYVQGESNDCKLSCFCVPVFIQLCLAWNRERVSL